MNNPINSILSYFLTKNSNITPTQQTYIDTIKNGDSAKGEALADNLCQSMGMTREQAINQAKQFFHL